jgi:hypothetical protein
LDWVWNFVGHYWVFCWWYNLIASGSRTGWFSSEYFMFSDNFAVVLVDWTVDLWTLIINWGQILTVVLVSLRDVLMRRDVNFALNRTQLGFLLSDRNHFFTFPFFEFGLKMVYPVHILFFFWFKWVNLIGKL